MAFTKEISLTHFLDLKNDYVFTQVFGIDKNKDILISFLNDFFIKNDDHIEDVELISLPESLSKKIVVATCYLKKGRPFIIEMKNVNEENFNNWEEFYNTWFYIDEHNRKSNIQSLEVIFFAIMDFIFLKNKNTYFSYHALMDKDTHDISLNGFSFAVLELPKFNMSKKDIKTKVENWCYFFKNASKKTKKDLIEVIKPDPIMQKAYKEAQHFF